MSDNMEIKPLDEAAAEKVRTGPMPFEPMVPPTGAALDGIDNEVEVVDPSDHFVSIDGSPLTPLGE